jgi:hypothetical protein
MVMPVLTPHGVLTLRRDAEAPAFAQVVNIACGIGP